MSVARTFPILSRKELGVFIEFNKAACDRRQCGLGFKEGLYSKLHTALLIWCLDFNLYLKENYRAGNRYNLIYILKVHFWLLQRKQLVVGNTWKQEDYLGGSFIVDKDEGQMKVD